MHPPWRRRTDTELIEHIQSRQRWFARLKWLVIGFMLLGAAIILLVFQVEIARLLRNSQRALQDLRLNSYAKGYIVGFLVGASVGGGVAYFTLGLITIFGDVRRDRLLLDYHDRLKQAEMLPEDDAHATDGDPQP